MRRIHIEERGAAVVIHHKGGARAAIRMMLDGLNGPLAFLVTRYAAARAHVPVTAARLPDLGVRPAGDGP
jgi:hypothetical protein